MHGLLNLVLSFGGNQLGYGKAILNQDKWNLG